MSKNGVFREFELEQVDLGAEVQVELLDSVEPDIEVPVLFHQFVFDHETVSGHVAFGEEFLYFDLQFVEFVEEVVDPVIELGEGSLEKTLFDLFVLDLEVGVKSEGFFFGWLELVDVDFLLVAQEVDGFADFLESFVDSDEVLVLLVTV